MWEGADPDVMVVPGYNTYYNPYGEASSEGRLSYNVENSTINGSINSRFATDPNPWETNTLKYGETSSYQLYKGQNVAITCRAIGNLPMDQHTLLKLRLEMKNIYFLKSFPALKL